MVCVVCVVSYVLSFACVRVLGPSRHVSIGGGAMYYVHMYYVPRTRYKAVVPSTYTLLIPTDVQYDVLVCTIIHIRGTRYLVLYKLQAYSTCVFLVRGTYL